MWTDFPFFQTRYLPGVCQVTGRKLKFLFLFITDQNSSQCLSGHRQAVEISFFPNQISSQCLSGHRQAVEISFFFPNQISSQCLSGHRQAVEICLFSMDASCQLSVGPPLGRTYAAPAVCWGRGMQPPPSPVWIWGGEDLLYLSPPVKGTVQ
jgi:hypothetical protein